MPQPLAPEGDLASNQILLSRRSSLQLLGAGLCLFLPTAAEAAPPNA